MISITVHSAGRLYAKGFHVCGTFRLIQGGAPNVRNIAKKLAVDTTLFRRRGNVFVILWWDVCFVSVISTMHNVETVEIDRVVETRRRGTTLFSSRRASKPSAIISYNKFMHYGNG